MRLARRFACPACGTRITFAQAMQESEFAFPCRGCGKRLCKRLHVAWVVVPGMLVLLWAVGLYGVGWQLGATVFGLLLVATLMALLFGRVDLAAPGMLDLGVAMELKSRNQKDDVIGD